MEEDEEPPGEGEWSESEEEEFEELCTDTNPETVSSNIVYCHQFCSQYSPNLLTL